MSRAESACGFSMRALLLRSFRYYRWADAAVIVGMVVAAAVLTGALMVGDSVRGSLRQMAIQRLGPVDDSLTSPQFFAQSLADRLEETPAFKKSFAGCVPAILLRGAAQTDEARTAGVQIGAMAGDWINVEPGQCVINEELARSLAIRAPGAQIELALPALGDQAADSAFGRRGRNDTTTTLPLRVARIATASGMESMFSLWGGQRQPLNVWVNPGELQKQIGQSGRVNTLLVKEAGCGQSDGAGKAKARNLDALLRRTMAPEDYGMSIGPAGETDYKMLNWRNAVVPSVFDNAANGAGIPVQRVSAYLANWVGCEPGPDRPDQPCREIHYAMMAGVSGDVDGQPIPSGFVVLNQWTADRLGAKLGDTIKLSFYVRQGDGNLKEVSTDKFDGGRKFVVARIVPMNGLGADRTLVPAYKGLTDTDSPADWKEPAGMHIHQGQPWVTADDEAYWKKYRAAPKLLLNADDAKGLWGGQITGLRVPAAKTQELVAFLCQGATPGDVGLTFRPIKAEQLEAVEGGSGGDFAMLFVSFSVFLIAAAVMLVAMLFRLGVEQRARQIGLLSAVGFCRRHVRRLLMAEGAILALIGSTGGVVAGLGYTWLMLLGLRTWWVEAVGTTQLALHMSGLTMAGGWVGSMAVALVSVWWGVWCVSRVESARLLAGVLAQEPPPERRVGRGWRGWLAAGLSACGLGLIGAGVMHLLSAQTAFMAGGAVTLVACLLLVSVFLTPRRSQGSGAALTSLIALGIGNAARHRGRSVLVVGLIALATFTLVAIASMQSAQAPDVQDPKSGAGGYDLLVQADLPLYGDLSTYAGRRDMLAIVDAKNPIWDRTRFTSMRSSAGDDASCLNLTRPMQPTVLDVPPDLARSQRFTFARTIGNTDDPWGLLAQDDKAYGAIPFIADDETAQYILKVDVGKKIAIVDAAGQTRQMVLVGTLADSIFQGQILVSPADFTCLFPSRSGYHMVLAQTQSGDSAEMRRLLGTELADYAVRVEPTAEVLAAYKRVANTYLATFQTLGSLGLLLGTVGLAVVLLRNLIERRGELAMLSALGFGRWDRMALVLAENMALLVTGLLLGAGCAVLAVLPAIISSSRWIHLSQLGGALGAIFLVGTLAMVAALWRGSRWIAAVDLRVE